MSGLVGTYLYSATDWQGEIVGVRRVRSEYLRERIRAIADAYQGWVPTCPPCGEFIEACACACAYCGETTGCACAIGYGVATGGD